MAVLVLLGAAVTARAVEDRVIKYKNKEVVTCTVTKADLGGVDIEQRDKTGAVAKVSLGAADVAEIEWDVNDPEWRAGMSAFDSTQFGVAAQRFQGILNDPEELAKIRAAAKPALYYFCAESLFRAGKLDDAVPMFEKLMNEFKTSYYIPRAVGSLVDAAIQTSKLEKVPPLLAQIREKGGEQKALADYYEGQMLMAKGDAAAADRMFTAAAGSTSVPATKGMALMGSAQCAIKANNLTRARDLAKSALLAEPPASVAGAAHLTIGDALVAEADAQKLSGEALQSKLLDAVLEYMRVVEQYKGDKRTEPEAMLKAGDCLQRLYKSNPTARSADRHRALTMYNRLTNDSRYRTSRWAAQATEAIKNLR